MNNTDKLLRAFIEASGYEIEEVRTLSPPCKVASNIDPETGLMRYVAALDFERGYSIDYKVTKKDDFVPLPVQSKEWGCIVEYITDHYEDIEIGIDDFGALKPIMDFISRRG